MHYFEYRNDELFAEDVPMRELARRFGTPFYVYSARTLRRHFRVFDEAFAGTDHLICYAMKALSNLSILMINVESRPELHRVSEVAGRMKKRAPVSLRVNPDLDPGTHPHISTGHRDSKFGVPLSQLDEYYAEASALAQLEIVGLS